MIGKELWFEGMYQQIFRGGYRFWQGVVLLGFAGPLLSQLGVWWVGDILVKGTEYVVQVNPQTRISIAVTSALLSSMSRIVGRFTRERILRLFHKTSQMKDCIMWNFGTEAEQEMNGARGVQPA